MLAEITEYIGGVRAYLSTRAGLSPSRAVGQLGHASAWATRRPAVARGRDGTLGRAARLWADVRGFGFSYFPENINVYLFSVMNPTLINRSKLHGCPKIVKLSLLGLQKYHLSVSVVSSQLAVMIIGS